LTLAIVFSAMQLTGIDEEGESNNERTQGNALHVVPIALTVFWGPMAFAIMGGLLVGTVLTLVFLPTLYVAWFRGREAPPEKQGHEELCLASKATTAR
jgi:hypothetical protein